ncbi:MAG: hypothetical protein E3J82_02920 [Candidatus Thorarchaeota archaeon]|nr:MAG: hypothetical protein E3J82_02920 [Candidatus Thorarchaeota archaeon]
MASVQLGMTKRIKNAVTDAAAQTVIAVILTVGFVLIQILAGTGIFVLDAYSPVMAWYGPLQAVVIGFYFGINIMRNNKKAQPTPDLVQVMESLKLTNEAIRGMGIALNSLITVASEVRQFDEEEVLKMISFTLRKIEEDKLAKDKEPEEEPSSGPPGPGFAPGMNM